MSIMPIRSLTPSDAEAAASLIREAFASIPIPLLPPPSGARVDRAEIEAALAGGGGAGWDEGGLRGCILWREAEGGLYVGRLAVVAASRGRGIARALIASAELEARRRSLPFLHLEVRLALAGNRRLFAACGFVETVRRAHPGFDEPTTVRAEKHLA